jgi:hypothetical protein
MQRILVENKTIMMNGWKTVYAGIYVMKVWNVEIL